MKDAEAKPLALRKEFNRLDQHYRPTWPLIYSRSAIRPIKVGPGVPSAIIRRQQMSSTNDNRCRRRMIADGTPGPTLIGGATIDECLEILDRLLARFTECRISVSFTKNVFLQHNVDFLSHEVTNDGIRADSKKLAAIAKPPFPSSKK
ncbi:unnamed protein product [Phytophthora fragariaefolia]|uniref:Unnamed protein product n=1 Tax=Phytophthora fragariaefolia TaxID=1490495 RepID=A0A9W7CWU4_9STRA|nr:unnamed protein product [Phytophthora fragariaefolia]